MSRTVAWFSAGAASAVAAKIALQEELMLRETRRILNTPDSPLAFVVARCIVTNEHPDNDRFAADCSAWFGQPVIELRSVKYADCWDVWEKRRYLNGPAGALCTVEMKKKVRQDFAEFDDVNVFGFTVEEKDRADRFLMNNHDVECRFPLIERGLTKRDCYLMVTEAGIELPAMYKLGYHNANCVGCVKGGAGYWNKIRRDFPETFERMAALEESLGASCINGQPLRTLDPSAGKHADLELPDCGLFCGENGSAFATHNTAAESREGER